MRHNQIPWDRPPSSPAYDLHDPRATAGDRAEADPDANYHAVVNIPATDGGPGMVAPLRTLRAVLERAAAYRRTLAEGEEHPVTLKGLIEGHILSNEQIAITAQGWIKVGYIIDPYAAPEIPDVWWHPDSDRVRVKRPQPPRSTLEAMPMETTFPLRRANSQDVLRNQYPFIAQPGWIYTYEGEDYEAESAMLKAREVGSLDGWSWRRHQR